MVFMYVVKIMPQFHSVCTDIFVVQSILQKLWSFYLDVVFHQLIEPLRGSPSHEEMMNLHVHS